MRVAGLWVQYRARVVASGRKVAPNHFRPDESTRQSGSTASIKGTVLEVSLPWWAIFNTVEWSSAGLTESRRKRSAYFGVLGLSPRSLPSASPIKRIL